MCGISGICIKKATRSDPDNDNNATLVDSLVKSMKYRGPDHTGFYNDRHVSLGISRLSIVDASGGHQPLKNEDNSLILVCNGEIYNHFELRNRLEEKGHHFKTGSDAEVILHLYEEKGVTLLADLAGMFAFALWDRKKKVLLLARDRIGIKPLYIYNDNQRFIFNSEMAPLLKVLKLPLQVLPDKAWEFLSYGFPVDNRQTVHEKIRRLCPAEGCLISGSGEKFFTYWEPAYVNSVQSEYPLSIGNVEKNYSRSIAEHFFSEVPYALMLSGGLDSASIASFGYAIGHQPETITIGYEGNNPGDERSKARELANIYGLKINEVILTCEEYVSAFNTLMEHCDEPVADIAAIPQWKIFERAREMGFKVLLNGLGGDEIFYGYGMWNEASELFINKVYHPFFGEDDVSGFFYHCAYRAAREFLDLSASPSFRASGQGCDNDMVSRFNGNKLKGVDRIYHLLFKTWLPNNCLHLADRLSMAHSVELRVPMLDHRLVDYIQGLSRNERYYGLKGKEILKKLLQEKLPSDIVNRPKQGFTPPGKYMKDMVFSEREVVFDNDLVRKLFDIEKMEKLWANDTYLEIWFRLLVLAKWQQYICY